MKHLILLLALLGVLGCGGNDCDGNCSTDIDTNTDTNTNIDTDTEYISDPDITGKCGDGSLWSLDPTTKLCWQRVNMFSCGSIYDKKDQYERINIFIDGASKLRLPEIHEVFTLVRNCDFRDCPLMSDPGCTVEACGTAAGCEPCEGAVLWFDTDLEYGNNCPSLYSHTLVSDKPDRVWMLHATDTKIEIIHVSTDVAIFDNDLSKFSIKLLYEEDPDTDTNT